MRADSSTPGQRSRSTPSTMFHAAHALSEAGNQRVEDQALSAADQIASAVDQVSSDADHAASAEGRNASRLEQQRADLEQRASDADQEAADGEVRAGSPQTAAQAAASRRGRLLRRGATKDRVAAASGRVEAAERRADHDAQRGRTSDDRDSSSAERDAIADSRDETTAKLERGLSLTPPAHRELRSRARLRETVAAARGGAAQARRDAANVRAQRLIHEACLAIEDARDAERELELEAAHPQSLDRLGQIGEELPGAAERGELALHYQPLYDLDQDEISGFEALLRWVSPRLGSVPPDDFIPVAEESGAIVDIGDWVLATAVDQLASWRDQLPDRHLTMAVNVAPEQLLTEAFVEGVDALLRRTGVPPAALTLELTERTLVGDAPALRCAMERLRQLGVLLSVDDFGTGFSSLGRLCTFPLDELKIDRIFVAGLQDDARQRALVAGIISMSQALDLRVVAEGIETPEQRAILATLGCDHGQGYLMSRPLPAGAIDPLLRPRPEGWPVAA